VNVSYVATKHRRRVKREGRENRVIPRKGKPCYAFFTCAVCGHSRIWGEAPSGPDCPFAHRALIRCEGKCPGVTWHTFTGTRATRKRLAPASAGGSAKDDLVEPRSPIL